MGLTLTLTLADIGLLILFCLIVVVAIYLIITLKGVNKLVKDSNDLLNKNADSITTTTKLMPKLIVSTTETVETVKDSVEKVQTSFDEWSEVLSDTLVAAGEKVDTLGVYVNTAADIARIAVNFINGILKK